ncbi:MAG: hypothetical protein D6679_13805 [Candidatus Hydrogenedentota bacterium]|nr:MAG: hypothetical protein D6679_13805 [Candidatus Hydrogenedentota bacterium]
MRNAETRKYGENIAKKGGTGFSVATSFEKEFLDRIEGKGVIEIYGRMEDDGYGGGRHRFLVPKIGRRRLERHVADAREKGIGFNYLLNAADGGTGDAVTPSGFRRLRRFLSWLVEIGVESVTVVSPFLLRVVKEHTPLKVRVSVFARADDERKVASWLDLGASIVVLDSMLVNRDPKRLARLAKKFDSNTLEIFVNNRCELGCAWAPCHAKDIGEASRNLIPRPDACYFQCQAEFARDPARLMMQDWIRPEDLHLYEELGYRRFKIAGRGCSTERLVQRVQAYSSRRFDGNLLDLLARGNVHLDPRTAFSTFFLSGLRHLRLLRQASRTADRIEKDLWIENRALDGYLEAVFRKGGCLPEKCFRCSLCREWGRNAVRFPEEYPEALEAFQRRLVLGE